MADLDDDAITVTLPDDTDGGTVIAKVEKTEETTKAAPVDPVEDLKGQFETLKGTLNQTTQRLVGAERELHAKNQEIEAARKEVVTSQLDTVLTGLQAAEAEAAAAERDFIAAAEAGDFAAQARAQRKMAAAENKIGRLKEAEGDLKDQTAKPVPKQEIRQQPRQDDVVERFTAGMSPASAAWIRSHPECVTNPKMNARMLAAHNLAIADDIPVDSKEYFERIEAGIGATKTTQQESKPAVNIRPSAPVAPANGASGGMNGGGKTVTLTAREAQAATDGTHIWNYDDKNGKFKKGDPIGVQEFARRKAAMMKEGHYDKSFDLQ